MLLVNLARGDSKLISLDFTLPDDPTFQIEHLSAYSTIFGENTLEGIEKGRYYSNKPIKVFRDIKKKLIAAFSWSLRSIGQI